jgi:hypothetical protein
LLLLLAGGLAGCRSSNNQMLETALRMREQDLQAMREELAKLEFQNHALQAQLHGVHQPSIPVALKAPPPEIVTHSYGLRRITLGRTTGGYDEDSKQGDTALQVVIEPRDPDDHVIKAPGSAQVTALEVTAEGLKLPIGNWQISQDQLRRSWKQSLFTNGYALILPWQRPPHSKNVRVVVRFQVIDGRVFEADRDVIVRPLPTMPPANGHAPAPHEPLPTPQPADQAPWLPPPGVPAPGVPAPGVPAPGVPAPGGPVLQPTGHWSVPGLEDSFHLQRPVPVYATDPDE